jgi:hypothetical protein
VFRLVGIFVSENTQLDMYDTSDKDTGGGLSEDGGNDGVVNWLRLKWSQGKQGLLYPLEPRVGSRLLFPVCTLTSIQ